MHLLKLPLYLVALPFFILTAVGRAGLCAVSGGGRLWKGGSHDCERRTWHGPRKPDAGVRVPVSHAATATVDPNPSDHSPSRFPFIPGIAMGAMSVLGCVLLLFAFVQPTIIPGVEVPAVSAQEINDLIAQVTGPRRPPIPVVFAAPPESGETPLAAQTEDESDADAAPRIEDATSETLPVMVFDSTEPVGKPVQELPEWASAASDVSVSETGLPGVIKTSQQATVEDAEREALLRLRLGLSKTFAALQPQAGDWLPPEEVVLDAGVVTRRAIERSEVKVGEFTEPVFRAYWDITQPEDLESRLFAAWRPEALKARLWLLGGGMGLLTLLFGSLAGYFRLDDATQGKYRNKLRVGTGALWALVAAGSAVLLVS